MFMDGAWTISMAVSLPLARPAQKLARTRPPASILGPHTMSSALGVLLINFIFAVIALSLLWHQDWFQCRTWEFNDVSNVLVIRDNYESEVLFLVTGTPYISSAMAYNFGYEFRAPYWRNYIFVLHSSTFFFLQLYITLVPGSLSCPCSVNCVNEDVVGGVTSRDPIPIQNPFNTTVMPSDFRVKLFFIIVGNTIAVMA